MVLFMIYACISLPYLLEFFNLVYKSVHFLSPVISFYSVMLVALFKSLIDNPELFAHL